MSMPKQKPGKSRQDYGTPNELLFAVKNRLNIEEFEADLAASDSNAVAANYYTESDNALSSGISWCYYGWTWLNPPYSNIRPWVEKAWMESQKGAHIVMLIPASVGANWWKDFVEGKAYVAFLNGRVTFVGESTPYPKDCALLFYTPWGFSGSEVWSWQETNLSERMD